MAEIEDEAIENITSTFRRISSIPSPASARYIPAGKHFVIESSWNTHDFGRLKNTTFCRTIFGVLGVSLDVSASVVNDSSAERLSSISPSGTYKAVLREVTNDTFHQYLEIWSQDRLVMSFNMLESKKHGKIYCDEFMGALKWNDSEDTMLYVAEKYEPKSHSYFEQFADSTEDNDASSSERPRTIGKEFVYYEDWGESYVGKGHSVLCTLHMKSRNITVLPILETEKLSLCQPIWTSGGKSIYFVAYSEAPYHLGMKYCTNRMSKIYRYELETGNISLISDEGVSARSPRISPDNQTLVYIQNEVNGPHVSCSQLIKYGLDGKHTVVDIVKCGLSGSFPGIYAQQLPERCFSNDGRYVFFSSIWQSYKVILSVDLKTHVVQKIPVGNSISCCTVLDVFDNVVIASASCPNVEPYLIGGKICSENDIVTVLWSCLGQNTPNVIGGISWSVQSFDPPIKNPKYVHLNYEAVVLVPEECKGPIPLILFPHGGPHSSFIAAFSEIAAAFVQLGYGVCMVNYRGSLGFGQDSISSLLGNVGEQDINDVYYALEVLKKDCRFSNSDVFLYGGSHGGFIIAHLSAKYPGDFAACVSRNPVIDIASMNSGSDIPDWSWVECGLGKLFNYDEPDEYALSEMWNHSPIKYVDNVKVPTLLLLGKNDRRVPFSQGLMYYRALKKNKVPVRVCTYPDDHSLLSFSAHSDGFVQAALWFNKYRTTFK